MVEQLDLIFPVCLITYAQILMSDFLAYLWIRGEKRRAPYLPLKDGGTQHELETSSRQNLALRVLCSLLLPEDHLGRSTELGLASV